MAGWLVELSGHQYDLAALAELFTLGDFRVIKETALFFLKCTNFDSLSDSDDVYTAAKSLIQVLNGIGSAYRPGCRGAELSGCIVRVQADGTRKRFLHKFASSGLHLADSVNADGGNPTMPRVPTEADAAMQTALNEEVVRRALQFFSLEKSWVNLYKVLDAVKDDMGTLDAVKAENWVPASEISRFTGTANNHTAAQGDARHGCDYGRPMQHPMSLAEAEHIIRTILVRWLLKKNGAP